MKNVAKIFEIPMPFYFSRPKCGSYFETEQFSCSTFNVIPYRNTNSKHSYDTINYGIFRLIFPYE